IHGEGEEVRDRMAWDLDPDRVDKDDASDPRRPTQRHLGGDPATDRIPDHGDVGQLELVEQRDIQRGQPANAVQRVGPGRAAETGMGWRDDPDLLGFGEQVGESADRERPGAAVEDHERTPPTTLRKSQIDIAHSLDSQRSRGRGGRGGHARTPLSMCSTPSRLLTWLCKRAISDGATRPLCLWATLTVEVGSMADSLYDRLGGIDAITAVVGSFRDRVAGDDRINLKFARTDLARLTKMGIDHPIVLAGMSGQTSPELVAAVTNAGGLGIRGLSDKTADLIPEAVDAVRRLTKGPFGLNQLLAFAEDDEIRAVLDAQPAVYSTAWPRDNQDLKAIFEMAHDRGLKVMHMVPTVADAVQAAAAGADVIVAQGTDGGGHIGLIGTVAIVPQVVKAVSPIPVLAAGGISDGRGLAAMLALGADGVLLGTRFLATPEAALADPFKKAILDSDGTDTIVTDVSDILMG